MVFMRAKKAAMHRKNSDFRQMHFALAILLFSASAIAQPGVLIGPSDGNSLRPVYLNEVRNYILAVTNDSNADVRDFGVEIFAPPELSFPVDFEGRKSRYFNFPLLTGGQSGQKIFQVKAVSIAPGPVGIVSRYGQEPFPGSLSTEINIAPGPLALSAAVMPVGALSKGSGSVRVGISNSSQEGLSNIRAEVLSRSSSFGNGPLEAPALSPGQAAGLGEFRYSRSENSWPVVVRVLFEDSAGRHVIEQEVAEPPAENSPLPLLAVGLIVLLVVFSLYGKKFQGAPEQGGSHPERNDSRHFAGHDKGNH